MVWPRNIDISLNKLEDAIEKARHAEHQSYSTISSLNELPEELERGAKVIYVIEQVGGNPDRTFRDFCEVKNNPEAHKMPRINTASKILYVGSSSGGLKNRLKQHLEQGPKGTYALHLGTWLRLESPKTPPSVRVHLRKYEVERKVLLLVEDALAHALRPAFGKRGDNAKGT